MEKSFLSMSKKLFKSTDDWQSDSIIRRTKEKWLYYAEGYKISMELIESELFKKYHDIDFLLFPLLYLHRHNLELKLKEIIVEGNYILGNKDFIPKGGHDLMILWNETQSTLKEVWQEQYEKPQQSLTEKINEFHSLDIK